MRRIQTTIPTLTAVFTGIFLTLTGGTFNATEKPFAIRDAAAITKLKEQSKYDTPAAAVRTARREESGRRTENQLKTTAGRRTLTQTPESNAADDASGFSVAISGDTAVIGMSGGAGGTTAAQGSAFVFVRFGATWIQQQKLVAGDGAAGDEFGKSVAIAGDAIVVGAPGAYFGTSARGSAYVFVRKGAAWTRQQKLTGDEMASSFGYRVAISGETVIIGAPGEFRGENFSFGAAYIFARSGANWTRQQKLVGIGAGGECGDTFGGSVAISGDTAVVSESGNCAGASIPPSYPASSAHIFVRSGTTWSRQQLLYGLGLFGGSVAIEGDTVVGGMFDDSVGTNFGQGSAYVFVRNGMTWTLRQKLVADDGAAYDFFGSSVAISGGTIVVSAPFDDIGSNQNQGSAYTFVRLGKTWMQQQKLTAGDGAANDVFGRSAALSPNSSFEFGGGVAISGETVIVAAPGKDNGANIPRGSSYIFARTETLWTQKQKLTGKAALKTQFDFDGDGKADFSVFRPSDRVWYLLRSQLGFTAAQFGLSSDRLAPADYDGDGKTDIAVFREGVWYWVNSSNGSFQAVQFGQAGDVPVPANYTGDERAELAVYRDGVWYIYNLANNQFQVTQFGISTDKPVPADYDGDGNTDMAVYRGGRWLLQQSRDGFAAVNSGLGFRTNKPVPADYDGDGKTDAAIFREGAWYLQLSLAGFTVIQFGLANDVPVPADYDGDGRTDIAVYRNGFWYFLRNSSGFSAMQFGSPSDKPIPSAFLP